MELKSQRPHATLVVVPYHCPELARTEELQPLVEALRSEEFVVDIRVEEPQVTEGAEEALQLFLQAVQPLTPIAVPVIAGAGGAIAAGTLGRFGARFTDWLCDWLPTKLWPRRRRDHLWPRPWRGHDPTAGKSFKWVIQISPPPSYPSDHRFPIRTTFAVGPADWDDPTATAYFGVGPGRIASRAELRARMRGEFNRMDSVIAASLVAMHDGQTPPGMREAILEYDPSTDGYQVVGSVIGPDEIWASYFGTLSPNGIQWQRR